MTLPDASVWLDAQGAQNRTHFDRGIPRYVRDHALALAGTAPTKLAAVGLNPALPLTANLQPFVGGGLLEWGTHRPEPAPRIFHSMSPFELQLPLGVIWPDWARGAEVRTAVTLYDLIPLVFPDHYLRDPVMCARYEARADFIRGVDRIFAISQTTAHDAVRLLGVPEDRVTVIDAGVTEHFATAFSSAEEARHLVTGRFPEIRGSRGFMLYVAGIEFRKNIDRLVEAHGRTSERFRDEHQLVITCRMRPEDEAHLRGVAERAGCREGDVVLTNYVTDTELAALYATCGLFVFASFYEGSGLPILEAMSCGAPVVASRTSTSPEILGDAAGTFDPHDVADIARVLEEALTDDVLLDRLRERSARRVGQYSWTRTAEATLDGYEQIQRERSRRGHRRATRIALHTPWPPERSGIAMYNRRLVDELCRHVEIDIVVTGSVDAYAEPAAANVRLLPDLGDGRVGGIRAHDRVVYCMGNSHFHHGIYDALRRRPGVVVAHDVRLGGFFSTFVEKELPEDPALRLTHRYEDQYGERLGMDLYAHRPDPWEQSDLGVYLTQEMQRHAERILVHSHYAADLLRLDAVPEPPAETSVVPFAFPPVRPETTRPLRDDGGTIVSFGIVSPTKMPDVLVEALAHVRRVRPAARLVFAGGAPDDELARVRTLARDVGVGDGVDVLGHVDDATYDELLDTAHVAVQLRRLQNGEASAAVADTMAAGLPAVVTAEGWAAELPDDTIVKVPLQLSAPVLADAILGILGDPGRASMIGAEARDLAARSSFATVAERYLEILGIG